MNPANAAIVALFIWLTVVSTFITGYTHIYGTNHPYQLVLVQKLNDPSLYPNDPFSDTVYHYASVLWYVIARLSRFLDISIILFIFLFFNKFLFLLVGFRLARTFFPDTVYAPAIGMVTMAVFPQLIFGGGYETNSTQQSSLAIAALLLALDAFLNRRWIGLTIWLGLALNLNLMFSIHAMTYLAASSVVCMCTNRSTDFLQRTIVAVLGGVLIGAPAVYLVGRASMNAECNPRSVWQAIELSTPYHFYPQMWEIPRQLLALLFAITILWVVWRFRNASPVGAHIAAWTGTALGWYLLGWVNPLILHLLPLMHLHPVRALIFWQLASMVFLTAFLVHLVKDNKRLMEQKRGYLYLISEVVIIFINKFYLHSISVLLIVASVVSWRFLRQISLHRGIRSGDFLLTVAVVWVVSLAACGVLVWSVLFPKKSAFAVFQSPSIPVAEWARKNTSKESVFLIPIYSEGGWALFRHLSQRNVFVHYKDGSAVTYAPYFADEWLERVKALGLHETLGIDENAFKVGSWVHLWRRDAKNFVYVYDKVDDSRVKQLKKRYRIDYWITRSAVRTRFPKVYENEGWKVLKVSE